MTDTKRFSVDVEVVEHDDHTEAKVHLDLGETSQGGWGRARRNPVDVDRPRIGDELAMARALSDLAHHLIEDVATQIEATQPADLHL